ncbi:hypothetical protein Lal_00033599 [Lupinus albus]|nr:hypothetical protein Lal_00033599 [Lupinus albus]
MESDGGTCATVVGETDVGTCVEVEEESYKGTCDVVVEKSDEGTYVLLVGENGACGEDDGGSPGRVKSWAILKDSRLSESCLAWARVASPERELSRLGEKSDILDLSRLDFGSSNVASFGSSDVASFGSSDVASSGSSDVASFGSSDLASFGSSDVACFGSSDLASFGSSDVASFGSSNYQSWDSRLNERFSLGRDRLTWEGEILGYTGGFSLERELARLSEGGLA